MTACGPIPKPFQATDAEKLRNPLLDVRDGAGVTIAPLLGAPPRFAVPVTEDLVLALREKGVPASASGVLTNGLLLEGMVLQSTIGLALEWSLYNRDGVLLDSVGIPVPGGTAEALWSGEPRLIEQSVTLSAEILADVLRPGSREQPPPPPSTIIVAGVQGAPGDGDRSLARAMIGALREADLPVVREVGENTLSLAAQVLLEPVDNAQETIIILWTLLDANGEELGTLEQKNTISRGQLSGRWGATAYDIAQANVDAIGDILAKVDNARAQDQRAATIPSN